MMNFLSTPNNKHAIPTKLFDYMINKIPVISSHLKYVAVIFKKYQCGIIYKNDDSKLLAKKIDYLIENYSDAIRMGKNGYKAIINDLNWKTEEKKLIIFYKSILKS
jgi:glycosyltransferase involved in cell wall biosynthesis